MNGFFAPTTIQLQEYMSRPATRIGKHVTILAMGKDTFGVDADKVFLWWLQFCDKCEMDLVIAHSTETNSQIPLGPEYVRVPGSQRVFATFKMTRIVENAAGLRNDADYQRLIWWILLINQRMTSTLKHMQLNLHTQLLQPIICQL